MIIEERTEEQGGASERIWAEGKEDRGKKRGYVIFNFYIICLFMQIFCFSLIKILINEKSCELDRQFYQLILPLFSTLTPASD